MNKIVRRKFQLSAAGVLLLLFCIAVNFAGKFVATVISLPFWLDSIGTCFAAVVCGPVGGSIVGILTNIILEIVFGNSLPYMVVSVAIAVVVGTLYPDDNDFFQIVFTAIFVAIVAIAISAPLNFYIYDGVIYNLWGDALYSMLLKYNLPVGLCSIAAQAFIDIPDKAITLLIVGCIVRNFNGFGQKKEGEDA